MTRQEQRWRRSSLVADINFCLTLAFMVFWPSVFKAVCLAIAFALSAYNYFKLGEVMAREDNDGET